MTMTTMQSLVDLLDAVAGSVLPLLMETSLKGAAILLVAAGVVLVLRRGSAANRHLVWVAGLAGVALLPVVGSVAPRWKAVPVVDPLRVVVGFAGETAVPGDVGPGSSGADERSAEMHVLAPDGSQGATARRAPPAADAWDSGVRRLERVGMTGGAVPSASRVPAKATIPGQTADPGEATSRTPGSGFPVAAGALLLGVWLTGAMALGLAFLASAVRLLRLARTARHVSEGALAREIRDVSAELGLTRPVQGLISDRTAMPMTWGLWRPRVLLPADATRWPRERLRHVLLHELAHVRRMDQPIQLLAHVVRAIHWFNPLVWLAVARIKVEREKACDDRVLQAGCAPSVYAQDLLSVARGLRGPNRPMAAAAAVPMARRSGLPERVEAILDPRIPRRSPGRTAGIVTAVVVVLLLVPLGALAPAGPAVAAQAGQGQIPPASDPAALPPQPPAPEPEPARGSVPGPPEGRPLPAQSGEGCILRKGGSHSVSVNADEKRWDIRWSVGDCSAEVEIRGDVDFLPDESGVARMGSRSRLEIEEEYGGTTRRIRMEPGPGGEPGIEYWVDGDRRDFDAEGRGWLASFLPQMFRHTTVDSEGRARRILERGGVSGLLREIDLMESDHVAARYFEHLLAMAELSPAQVVEILDLVARRLDSDHYRAKILTAVARGQGLEPGYRSAYLAAARGLDSDHYKHRILDHLLDRGDLEPETLSDVLDASRDVDSDHYRSRLLQRVAAAGAIPPEGRRSFLRAMESLESDHYSAQVVEAFLRRGELDDDELAPVLELVEGIGSDHYRGRVLEAVLDRVELDDDGLLSVIGSVTRMGSDHQAGRVLRSLARRYHLDGRVRDAFVEAAEGLGSRHTRDRVLAALVRGA